jgi:hypothetical protein
MIAPSEQSLAPKKAAAQIPPLENGDNLTSPEFLRRYE